MDYFTHPWTIYDPKTGEVRYMAKEDKKKEYKGEERRRQLLEGETREEWTQEERESFLENYKNMRPYLLHHIHVTKPKEGEKKKFKFPLPLVGIDNK